MADVTNVFKANVKAVKSRQKLHDQKTNTSSKSNILPTAKQRGDFETKARNLVREYHSLFPYLSIYERNTDW